MHAQTLRRRRYIAATLLMDAHDVLPADATEPKRHVGYRGQLGRSVKQRVDQLVRVDRLRKVIVGTGTQGHYHRGKTVDVGNYNDSQAC